MLRTFRFLSVFAVLVFTAAMAGCGVSPTEPSPEPAPSLSPGSEAEPYSGLPTSGG